MMSGMKCSPTPESAPAHSPCEQINQQLAVLLKGLQAGNPEGACIDAFSECLASLGASYSREQYSLTLHINTENLGLREKETLDRWKVEAGQSRIPLAPPIRETTGTHGSGEREKLACSVQTLILHETDDSLTFKINLWGRYSGLYYKLDDALTLTVPVSAVLALEITPGPQWIAQLATSAERIYEAKRERWPAFVEKQVEELTAEANALPSLK